MSSQLNAQEVEISLLNSSEYNPRKWSAKAIQDLTESIKRFGLIDPIIANGADNRKNIVIGGHFRLKIARDLSFHTVPVIYLNISDIEKEKELNLRLNHNTGEWDYEILREFDMNLLLDVGFDDSDLSEVWDQQLSAEDDEFDVTKELAKISEPKTKLGDLYLLGNHRLVCGDSTDFEVVKKLMDGNQANMLYFDPPYNINLSYNDGISTNGKYGGEVNDDKSSTDYSVFLEKVLSNGISVGFPDLHIFTWCDENNIGLVQKLYQNLSIQQKRVCLWVKNNHNMTPQVAFNKVYEPCVYGIKGRPYLSQIKNFNEVLNKEIQTGNQLPDDILDLFSIWLVDRKAGQTYVHPTEKPVTLHEKPLRRCTKTNDIVVDLFGGSGSTLIACEQMSRRSFLAEISPQFCDVIVERYEKLTGKKAELCK